MIAGAVAREVSVVLCVDVVHLPALEVQPGRVVRVKDLLHVADRSQEQVEDVSLRLKSQTLWKRLFKGASIGHYRNKSGMICFKV